MAFRQGARIETGREKPWFDGFVSRDDLRAIKKRLNPTVIYLDGAIRSCKTVPDSSRAAWNEFANNWRAFYAKEISFFSVADDYDTARDFEYEIDRWVHIYEGFGCPVAAPSSPRDSADNAFISDKTHTTLQMVAVSGVIIALVVGLRGVMK